MSNLLTYIQSQTKPRYTDLQQSSLSQYIKTQTAKTPQQTTTQSSIPQKYGTVNGTTKLPSHIENQGYYDLSGKLNQQNLSGNSSKTYNKYYSYVKNKNETLTREFNAENLKSAYIGVLPSTNTINPLQTEITGVGYRQFVKGHGKLPHTVDNTKFQLYNVNSNERLFEIEKHKIGNTLNVPHINTIEPKKAKPSQKKLATYWNEKEVSEEFYDAFRNFDDVADNVKFAGKAIATAGIILEAVELIDTVYEDLNDEDGKLGKKFAKVTAGITGDWAGSLIGAEIGALGGAAIGSNILLGPGTLIGGFIGGTIGGVAGSIAGRNTMENWVEKYYMGD